MCEFALPPGPIFAATWRCSRSGSVLWIFAVHSVGVNECQCVCVCQCVRVSVCVSVCVDRRVCVYVLYPSAG